MCLGVDLRTHTIKSCVQKRLDDVLKFVNYSGFNSLLIWIDLFDCLEENLYLDNKLYIRTRSENV